jgi:nucleoside-diphosphate-sugar epimerase
MRARVPFFSGNRASGSPAVRLAGRSGRRILVLGGAGYLGSVLVGQLLRDGFTVRVLDIFLFGDQSLDEFKAHPNFELVCGDIRDIGIISRSMRGCDVVIHLAAIVGDLACEEHRGVAIEINRDATTMLAKLARSSGVPRFIFASSCSVYGASEKCLDETSPSKPLSLYAQTKRDSEDILLRAAGPDFAPTVLRLGTLFGLSPRMRFDLVVNLFVAQAASLGRITIWNEEQWRPFLHVQDAARAFIACLNAPSASVSGQVFNVGSPSLNLQLRILGKHIARFIPNTRVDRIATQDRRDYRVSFAKVERVLRFRCARTLAFGIKEIYAAVRSGMNGDFVGERFNNQTAMRALAPSTNQRWPLGQTPVLMNVQRKLA